MSGAPATTRPRARKRGQSAPEQQPTAPPQGLSRAVCDVPTDAIHLTAHNPRTDGEQDLEAITASLASGMAQIPTLEEIAPGEYRVLLGERRVRAAVEARWDTIPCVVVQPQDAIQAHRLRLVENLNRRDLRPIDEARALRIDWLCANASALGLREAALVIMDAEQSPPARLAALTELLEQSDFVPRHPPITQEATLALFGLTMNKERLKKLLRVLAVDTELQQQAQDIGLTEAALRALGTLGVDDQEHLLRRVIAEPPLAKRVRSVVQGVRHKGRTVDLAIAIVQGRFSDEPDVPTSGAPVAPVAPPAADTADETSGADATEPAPSSPADVKRRGRDPGNVGEQVNVLVQLAERLDRTIGRLVEVQGKHGLRGLPAPFGELAGEAIDVIDLALRRIR